MTEHDAFLAAIIENIEDDTPRLVYADWLEEHDQPERAEFIRVQCELEKDRQRRMRKQHAPKGFNRGTLRRREKELRSSLDWTAIFRREFPVLFEMTHYIDTDNPAVEWRRGFIAEITLTCSDWLQHRDALLKAAPLEKVTLKEVAIGDVHRESDMLVCPVFSWGHGCVVLHLHVQQGQLWYWMEPDRVGDSFGVCVFAVEGDIPVPRWASIEDSFRNHWNRMAEARYAQDVLSGYLTPNEARVLMRRELMPDFSA